MTQPALSMRMPLFEFVARCRADYLRDSLYHVVDDIGNGLEHFAYDFADKVAARAYHAGLAGFVSWQDVDANNGRVIRDTDPAYAAGTIAAGNALDAVPGSPDPLSEEFNEAGHALPAGWVVHGAPIGVTRNGGILTFSSGGLNGGGESYNGVKRPIASLAAEIVGRTILWKIKSVVSASYAQVGVGVYGSGGGTGAGLSLQFNTEMHIQAVRFSGGSFQDAAGGRDVATQQLYVRQSFGGVIGALTMTIDISIDGVSWSRVAVLNITDPTDLWIWAQGSNGASGATAFIDFMRYIA